MKSICERLLLQVSCWNFTTTQTFMNKNNYISFNVKSSSFVTLEIYVLYWVSICKLLKVSPSTIQLRVKFLWTSSHQTNLQNFSYPPHLSVLQHLPDILSHLFFYIAVFHSLLYIQPPNGIIGIISKNSTAFPVDTGRKLHVHETSYARSIYVLCLLGCYQ